MNPYAAIENINNTYEHYRNISQLVPHKLYKIYDIVPTQNEQFGPGQRAKLIDDHGLRSKIQLPKKYLNQLRQEHIDSMKKDIAKGQAPFFIFRQQMPDRSYVIEIRPYSAELLYMFSHNILVPQVVPNVDNPGVNPPGDGQAVIQEVQGPAENPPAEGQAGNHEGVGAAQNVPAQAQAAYNPPGQGQAVHAAIGVARDVPAQAQAAVVGIVSAAHNPPGHGQALHAALSAAQNVPDQGQANNHAPIGNVHNQLAGVQAENHAPIAAASNIPTIGQPIHQDAAYGPVVSSALVQGPIEAQAIGGNSALEEVGHAEDANVANDNPGPSHSNSFNTSHVSRVKRARKDDSHPSKFMRR